MRRIFWAIFAMIISALIFMPSAGVAGGMCVEDLKLTTDGIVVFSDNFNMGKLDGWMKIRDVSLVCAQQDPPDYFLKICRQGKTVACAYHSVSVPNAGDVIELNAWIWLPKVSEQKSGETNFYISSGSDDYEKTKPDVHAGPAIKKGSDDYYVRIGQQYGSSKSSGAISDKAVIKPEKWALFTLRIDRTTGNAVALVDGKQACQIGIDSADFPSISQLSIWGWLGDTDM